MTEEMNESLANASDETIIEMLEEAIESYSDDVDDIRQHVIDHDVERPWDFYEDGEYFRTETHSTIEEALEACKEHADRDNYPDAEGTLWFDMSVRCELTDEEESVDVQLDADEPECECAEGCEHEWQAPHEVVGGCDTNPGVWGNGGGVIIKEVCAHCGVTKVTDTWATRPDNGTQGHTVVRYESDTDHAQSMGEWLVSEASWDVDDDGDSAKLTTRDGRILANADMYDGEWYTTIADAYPVIEGIELPSISV